MSILNDQLLADFDNADLTEDDMLSLVHAIARKYHWTAAIWTMGDVLTLAEGEDPDEVFVGDGDRPELTVAMKWSVANTWEWRKGITDIASERVNDMIPTVTVYDDGSYSVEVQGSRGYYNADGSPANGS